MKKPLWFKAKSYGWGWYPSSWQGWVILIIYVAYIGYRAQTIQNMFDGSPYFVLQYSFEILVPTVLLIVVCYLTGEKPEWRWGKKKIT